MSKTAITLARNSRRRSAPFSQAIESRRFPLLQRSGRPRPGHWQGGRGGYCGRDRARLSESLGGSQGGRQEFRSRCARAGVYLTSMSDFVAMNGIYAKYFSQPFPARTTIAVAAFAAWGLR